MNLGWGCVGLKAGVSFGGFRVGGPFRGLGLALF